MYHDICDEADSSGFAGMDAALYKLTPAAFRRQIASIAESGKRRPVLVTAIDYEPSAVFITFDDGGKSAIDAAEVLEQYNWRGHFFVTTERIETGTFLKAAEIADLHRRGHIIGSHSHSHPLRMASLKRAEKMHEWQTSVRRLEDIIGEKVKVASVPGGLYSREVAECAEANGIEFLFTSEPTMNVRKIGNCVVLGRYAVQHSTNCRDVAAAADGDRLPWLKQQMLWNVKKPIKKLGGESFLRLREALIARRG
jgi:peptidoglycan/xylan/chitin deacetylase (PgdA/CDA1 family)